VDVPALTQIRGVDLLSTQPRHSSLMSFMVSARRTMLEVEAPEARARAVLARARRVVWESVVCILADGGFLSKSWFGTVD